jgi:cold shock protein
MFYRSGTPGTKDGEDVTMSQGTVKWFNDAKGYGFITRSEDGKDVFVHYTSIQGDGFRTLAQGQKVEYECMEGPKGLYAAKVSADENSATAAVPS